MSKSSARTDSRPDAGSSDRSARSDTVRPGTPGPDVRRSDQQAELDETDRRILGILQRDARIPNTELADEVGLTPAPTLRRVRRLEEEGVIRRYVALLDPKKVGRDLTVFVDVSLDKQTKPGFETFAEQMRRSSEVLECYLSLGESDFILKVCVPDLDAYQRFLVDVLAAIPGVRNTSSTIVVRQEKYTTSLPLGGDE